MAGRKANAMVRQDGFLPLMYKGWMKFQKAMWHGQISSLIVKVYLILDVKISCIAYRILFNVNCDKF